MSPGGDQQQIIGTLLAIGLTNLGAVAILVLTGWLVPKGIHQEVKDDLKFYREIAFHGADLSERATGLAEQSTNEVLRRDRNRGGP